MKRNITNEDTLVDYNSPKNSFDECDTAIIESTDDVNKTHQMKRDEFQIYYTHRIAGESNVGLVREINEDSYGYFTDTSETNFIVVVADGVGGHERGDEASKKCVANLLSAWRNLNHTSRSYRYNKKFLQATIVDANKEIFDANTQLHLENPMGTTVTTGIFTDNLLIIGHVGDSKCFRVNSLGIIEQLTEDHTLVYELFKQKLISEYQMANHPLAHVISRAIGPDEEVEVDIYKYNREPGSCYVFCSDGVTDHVTTDKIREIMLQANNPNEACKNLIQAALDGGGNDNITAVCVFD